MKWSSVLPVVAILYQFVEADQPGWTEWVTSTQEVWTTTTVYVPTTIKQTYWYTTTVVQPTTITSTVIQPTTVTVPTTVIQPTTVTVATTVIQPTTVTVATTVVQPTTVTVATTVVQPTTVTVPVNVPTTVSVPVNVPTTVTVTSTVVSVSGQTIVNTATVQNTQTVVNTVVNTVNSIQTIQVTSISVATSVVSISFCPSPSPTLTGLVPCPSRVTNEQGYTPPAPLPSNYLWGCAPGYLCHPIQINCNFESNPPADTYICPPSQCLPVKPLPPPKKYAPEPTYTTCAWYTPIDDYFNINPSFYGLNFNIFATDGQTTCTTTTQYTTTMVTTTKASSWAPWSSSVPTPSSPAASSGWGGWLSGAPHPTKRALLPRQGQVVFAVPGCYSVADYAGYVYQSIGSVPALCAPGGDFQNAYDAVEDCSASNVDSPGVTTEVVELDDALNYCDGINSPVAKRDIARRTPQTMG